MFGKLKRYLKDPYWALGCDMIQSHPHWMSDKFYLSTLFRQVMGYKINWKNPKTFNEKLNWLKINDRNPLYTKLVDKYEVKQWVADIIGEQYVIPTLGVWNHFNEIDFNQLPNQFVLKCTHDSGSIAICTDKRTFDKEAACEKLEKGLKHNMFWDAREWPYKNVPPRIIAEKYLEFEGRYIMDYRIYCFNGVPKFIYAYTNYAQIDGGKPEPSNCDYFDLDWNPLPFHQHFMPRGDVKKPEHLDDMIIGAISLSKDIPFARVDFYESKVAKFGEITFYPGGGLSKIHPSDYDAIIGELLKVDNY